MKFLKTHRIVVIGVLIAGIVAIFSYRFVPSIVRSVGDDSQAGATSDSAVVRREVSAIATYEVPGGTDKVRFTLGLDSGGNIVAVRSTDVLKGDAVSDNLRKFSEGLLLVIRGKKLSDLKSIDRVGKSSLTTTAFNAVLPDLQKQL